MTDKQWSDCKKFLTKSIGKAIGDFSDEAGLGPEMTAEDIPVEKGKANKAGGCTSCGCSLRSAAA